MVVGFAPFAPHAGLSQRVTLNRRASFAPLDMKLGEDEKIICIGVAADSGCGKSTFMRRLTKVFGGANVGPLGGGFGNGGWETNTLCSDVTTVLCLDDYHANDRNGRKVSGMTALNTAEQNFDLMAEQMAALKSGKEISKPIYNHVNGTLDAPEVIKPTPIVIIEGLHPLADKRVRDLLDFTIYLDISNEIKFAWKIQRDMAERGWTREQVEADIEKRKPDFSAFVAPQMASADIVISVLPSVISKETVGTHLKVKLITKLGKEGLPPAGTVVPTTDVAVGDTSIKTESCGLKIASYKENFMGNDCSVVEMDGKITDINDYMTIEKLFTNTGAKTATELSTELIKVGPNSPGSLDGTGLFQTITALKLRDYYEFATGTKVGA
ncbi:phosphoribulokinase precursor [Ochromonadaceae sp. CCMP2298]|nr:phosphoribulokinase precursor [Ochromonadaceae sp. CCMP2298]